MGHADEKSQRKLLGGNADSNLVNLHYHAQQAEANILKMLKCLNSGIQPSDDDSEQAATNASMEHFLMIDNGGGTPKVLFDWATYRRTSDKRSKEDYERAAKGSLEIINKLPEWYSLGNAVYRIAQVFLPDDDPLLLAAGKKATHFEEKAQPSDLLPLLTVADEAVFRRLEQSAPALPSKASLWVSHFVDWG